MLHQTACTHALPVVEPFTARLRREGLRLDRRGVEVLQINLGKRCNQACHHCHVEAGPQRTEEMEPATARRIVDLLAASPGVHTVDLTGGAPELNSNFRTLVRAVTGLGKEVLVRSNLTVHFEPGQEDLGEFLRRHRATVIASLPCYTEENVDRQRGRGVFAKSLAVLRRLNGLGYGRSNTGLELNLVYNPGGPHLPGCQESLEADYRRHLGEEHGIEFSHLLTLANLPIHRFAEDLVRRRRLAAYMELLAAAFNPSAVEAVMCRELISVSWDGRLYDCDFNQMLEMPVPGSRRTIWDLDSFDDFDAGSIALDDHCYGCTAGQGSSCGGALV